MTKKELKARIAELEDENEHLRFINAIQTLPLEWRYAQIPLQPYYTSTTMGISRTST